MIQIYNRKTNKYDTEAVAGEKYINWAYESPIGKGFVELFIKRKIFSKLYGIYCDSKLSKRKISSFISTFNIDMDMCVNTSSDFENFNEFFIRRLTKEARPINKDKNVLISPGDGRLMAYTNIDINKLLVVTFTNAAASEMRERVLDAIYKKLEEDPENENLQRQITLLNMASICTIDSFCLEVVKNNFYELENIIRLIQQH